MTKNIISYSNRSNTLLTVNIDTNYAFTNYKVFRYPILSSMYYKTGVSSKFYTSAFVDFYILELTRPIYIYTFFNRRFSFFNSQTITSMKFNKNFIYSNNSSFSNFYRRCYYIFCLIRNIINRNRYFYFPENFRFFTIKNEVIRSSIPVYSFKIDIIINYYKNIKFYYFYNQFYSFNFFFHIFNYIHFYIYYNFFKVFFKKFLDKSKKI